MFDCVPNISKFAIFKDKEVVFISQGLQLLVKVCCVVLLAHTL